MRMYDIIVKKRDGQELTVEEISFLVNRYVKGEIPDYQMSAFLMAVFFRGMTRKETVALTLEMAKSGDMVDLSSIKGVKVDKHSTGGVGDKTTLVVGPIVAACGVKVAKMSGRGLGHTGGTIDKLEAIPGFQVDLERTEFIRIVNEVGISIIGQTGNITPADKKLYALRDVTGTVENSSLIASSIMSKKIAAGSDGIVLDVKTGTGAFMQKKEDAIRLGEEMVTIGNDAGRKTVALVTNMNIPLGYAIGNSSEVKEAIETLSGKGPEDLTLLSKELAANMLCVSGKGELKACYDLVSRAIKDGSALDKLYEMIQAHGGDLDVVERLEGLEKAEIIFEITSKEEGYIKCMDTRKCGVVASLLGAGRETKESKIDYYAGIMLKKKVGDFVEKGETIAQCYTSKREKIEEAKALFLEALSYQKEKPEKEPLIYAKISEQGIEVQ